MGDDGSTSIFPHWAINLVGQPLRVQQDALLSLFAHLEGEALYLARELHDRCPDSIPILQRAEVVDARLNDCRIRNLWFGRASTPGMGCF